MLIVVGLVLIGFFGFRAIRSHIRLAHTRLNPETADVEAIRGWMTVPYIAKAYNVPEDYLFTALNIPAAENRKRSLFRIHHLYHFSEKGKIIEIVKAVIQHYRQTLPPQPGPSNE